MNKIEAANYLISRMSDDDTIDGIDQNYILDNGLDANLSEAIRVLDLAMTANGALYRRDNIGLIPSIINDYYDERKEVKKEMLSVESEIERIKSELESRRLKNNNKPLPEYKGDKKRYKI